MSTVFTNSQIETETWSTQGCLVKWGVGEGGDVGKGQVPLLMQQIQIAYRRPYTEVQSISQDDSGKRKRVRIYGTPSGTLVVGSIFSPTMTGLKEFIAAITKGCKTTSDQVNISITPFGGIECSETKTRAYGEFILHAVDLSQLNVNITAGSGNGVDTATINVPMQFEFTEMDWNID